MTVSIYMYVTDCDKVYQAALLEGGKSIMEDKTMDHAGEKYGDIKDFCMQHLVDCKPC